MPVARMQPAVRREPGRGAASRSPKLKNPSGERRRVRANDDPAPRAHTGRATALGGTNTASTAHALVVVSDVRRREQTTRLRPGRHRRRPASHGSTEAHRRRSAPPARSPRRARPGCTRRARLGLRLPRLGLDVRPRLHLQRERCCVVTGAGPHVRRRLERSTETKPLTGETKRGAPRATPRSRRSANAPPSARRSASARRCATPAITATRRSSAASAASRGTTAAARAGAARS